MLKALEMFLKTHAYSLGWAQRSKSRPRHSGEMVEHNFLFLPCSFAVAVSLFFTEAAAQEASPKYETVVQAPSRLPENPISTSEFPASVQVVTHEEIVQSGTATVQDVLQRLPGVTLNDEQSNPLQPDITIRGIAASSVTGLSQGVSVSSTVSV